MTFPIEIRETRGVRTLHFGSDWVQGAMRISRPWDLELVYTREMMAALLLSPTWPAMPQRILQVGLGAGSLARFIYRYLPDTLQVVVEQSPAVIAAAYQGFNLPNDPQRLRIEVAEGVQWIAATDESFDLILVDGYDADGMTGNLESQDFYRNCRAHLTAGGLLACNFLGRNPHLLASCLALDTAFSGRSRLLPPSPGGNVIALASVCETTPLDEETVRERVSVFREWTGLDLSPLLGRLLESQDGLPLEI